MRNFCKHENPENARVFVVNWVLGTICNYRCRYCNDRLYAGQTRWIDLERCQLLVDRVFAHCDVLDVVPYFEFTGGEVTLYRQLPALLQSIRARGGKTGMITNGSAKPEVMESILPHLDHVCVSYHPTGAKDDRFVETVRTCAKRLTSHVNLMADPLFLDRVEAVFERVVEIEGTTLSVQPLQEKLGVDGKIMDYTAEQMAAIRSMEARAGNILGEDAFVYRGRMVLQDPPGAFTVPQIVDGKLNRWKGWSCNAGLECVAIHDDGGVYNAWCRQEYYGSLFRGDIVFPSHPVVCRKERCLCNNDIMVTKSVGHASESEESDYRGRFSESFREGRRRWDLKHDFAIHDELVLEFRLHSKWLLGEVMRAEVPLRLEVEFETETGINVRAFESRVLHMTGEVFGFGLSGGARLLSITATEAGDNYLANLKLHRLTSRRRGGLESTADSLDERTKVASPEV